MTDDRSMAAEADAALMTAIAERADRAAFAELFQRYAGRVKGFLMKGGLPAETAEEIAQEVMVTLWRKAASFDASRATLATWLFTIARNRRIDHFRRARREDGDPTDPSMEPEPPMTPEKSVGDADRDSRVRRALTALNGDQLEVVRLAFFAGLSHGEIAERIDAPLGTVKSRLRLSFQKLKAELGLEFSEELVDD